MFASARSAAATPLASPSLKHVLEFTHTHAHAHGSLVGLGIRVSPTMSSSPTLASGASPNALHSLRNMPVPSGSGQPAIGRPVPQRMQSSASTIISPRAPRLEASATLLPVFSSLVLTPMGNHSPLIEEYFSDANASSDNREAATSSSQLMFAHTRQNRWVSTANNTRSTRRSTLLNNPTYATEVERIGLGISGLSLNAFTPNRIISAQVLTDEEDSESESSMPMRKRKRMSTRSRRVRFYAYPYIIGSSNRNVDDGYNADAENEHDDEVGHDMRRNTGLAMSCSNVLRPCMGRVCTPYYATNGDASWL